MNILKSKWGVAAIAGVLVIGGGFAAVNVANAEPAPANPSMTDTALSQAADYTAQQAATVAAGLAAQQAEEAAVKAAADAEAARVAAEAQAAAQAAADAQTAADAAAVMAATAPESLSAAPAPEPVSDGIPAGAWPLRWIASSDPQNAQGGNWDFSGCSTGASTFNGVPYCLG